MGETLGVSSRLQIVVVWLLATVVGLTVAVGTRFGPVVVRLPGHEHGLHVGDLVGIGVSYGVALAVTLRLRRPS
jgi:hypothetical protein